VTTGLSNSVIDGRIYDWQKHADLTEAATIGNVLGRRWELKQAMLA
jgi:hypothetical protein